jgi:hypothetical protein
VHTLSVGAARPEDFDEHVAALEHYDRAAEITAPIVASLEQELECVHGSAWMSEGLHGLPNYDKVPGEVKRTGNPPAMDLRQRPRPRRLG